MSDEQWQKISRWALFFEEKVWPIFLLYFSATNMMFLVVFRKAIWEDFRELFGGGVNDISKITFLLDFNIRIIAIAFNLIVLLALLTRKKQPQTFKNAKELLVPLATVFFYFAYNLMPLFPKDLDSYLLPIAIMPVTFMLGNLFILSGLVISAIAVFNLRNSFAIFVETRGIVDKGIYGISRHPIYLGYLVKTIGACLLNFFTGYFVLSFLFLGLLIYRSLLEEQKMLKYCPEYHEYRRKTPSLFLQCFFLDRR